MSGPLLSRFLLFGMTTFLLSFLILHVPTAPAASEAPPFVGPRPDASGAGWVEMPAGARSAYMGIHGGTVPVSLLTAKDGQSMVTFVGRTGNDFLSILHKKDLRAKGAGGTSPKGLPANNATAILTTSSPAGNIPVFYCTGKGYARMELAGGEWQPFGLSEKPLLLEGQAGRPLDAQKSSVKKYRRFLLQQRLQRSVLSIN